MVSYRWLVSGVLLLCAIPRSGAAQVVAGVDTVGAAQAAYLALTRLSDYVAFDLLVGGDGPAEVRRRPEVAARVAQALEIPVLPRDSVIRCSEAARRWAERCEFVGADVFVEIVVMEIDDRRARIFVSLSRSGSGFMTPFRRSKEYEMEKPAGHWVVRRILSEGITLN